MNESELLEHGDPTQRDEDVDMGSKKGFWTTKPSALLIRCITREQRKETSWN
jgi:hypothetical protein